MEKRKKLKEQKKESKKESIAIKSCAIFCSIILITAIISFSVSLAPVKAQASAKGCCIKTKDIPAAYCQENVNGSDCEEEYFYTGRDCSSLPGGVSDYCKKGTCKPSVIGDQCQVNKPKFECIDIGGEWADTLSKDNFPDGWCQEGCCNIHGKIPCEIKEKKVCKDIAESHGLGPFTSDMFTTGLDEGQCKEICAGADRGCCVKSTGCEYIAREACGIGIPFQKDVYCSDVDICGIKNATYEKSCGGPDDGGIAGDEHKIYYYNEKGSRELLVRDCGYPAFVCKYCEDKECTDQLTQETVKEDEPYCKSTTCKFELKDMDSEGRVGSQSLLSGQRMCYNFDKDELGRTTGLQHYVLTCERGDVIPDALGISRTTLCEGEGKEKNNKYEDCTTCGEGGLWNRLGDHLQNTPLTGDLLGGIWAKPCEGLWSFWGVDRCKKFGDCRYNTDVLKKPMGSCVPEYTPGTGSADWKADYEACKLCGKGGDASVNYCDEEECNALGDCQFKSYPLGRLTQIGRTYLITISVLAIETIISCSVGCIGAVGGYWPCFRSCLKGKTSTMGERTQRWWERILNLLKPKILYPGKPETIYRSASDVQVARHVPGEPTIRQIDLLVPTILYSVVMGLVGKKAGSCHPEEPLDDSRCEYCGGENNTYRKCTPDRCYILGNCEPIPKNETLGGGQDYVCLERKCEGGRPMIEEMKAEWYVGETKVGEDTSKSVRIEGENIQIINRSEILPWNVSSLYLEVDTKEGAKCRYALDEKGQEWDNMFDFEENALFPDWQYASILTAGYAREHFVYVKCRDICGNEHHATWDYNYVYFRLDEKPDELPPEMTKIDPLNVYIDESVPSIDVKLWLDENGYCRYSKNLSKTDFAEMSDFICEQNQKCFGIDVDKCAHCKLTVDLTAAGEEIDWQSMPEEFSDAFKNEGILSSKAFQYVFVCKDAETPGNIGEPFNYTIVTVPGYNMSIVKPESKEKTYEKNPVIEVNTSRSTDCRYSVDEPNKVWEELTPITDHMTKYHYGRINETLKATQSGFKHTLYVTCKDFADIVRTDNVEFISMLDVVPPKIIRVYYEEELAGLLTILTDEESTCVYSIKSCDYDFEKGEIMPPEFAEKHSANWNVAWTYYIKCKDEYGNVPPSGSCTMIVHPYSVVR